MTDRDIANGQLIDFAVAALIAFAFPIIVLTIAG